MAHPTVQLVEAVAELVAHQGARLALRVHRAAHLVDDRAAQVTVVAVRAKRH